MPTFLSISLEKNEPSAAGRARAARPAASGVDQRSTSKRCLSQSATPALASSLIVVAGVTMLRAASPVSCGYEPTKSPLSF